MKKNPSAVELLNELENRLSCGDYKDSVHQIKLMTTRDIILEMILKRKKNVALESKWFGKIVTLLVMML